MADRRTLVSYDDLETTGGASAAQLGPPFPSTNQPAAKKRRTHPKAPPRRTNQHIQHWDDLGSNSAAVDYGDDIGEEDGEYAEEAEEEEESRELTHGEIWDDSALIDAWNSATAEYEVRVFWCSMMINNDFFFGQAYHGKTKKWKEEPVKKSPLYVSCANWLDYT
jgi:hypothetical protein